MKRILTLFIFTLLTASAAAQEAGPVDNEALESRTAALEEDAARRKRLKISGLIQGQYQLGQPDAGAFMKVGEKVGEAPGKNISRIGIRRGRVKLVYDQGIVAGTFQLDITERGVRVKDAFLNVKDAWLRSFQLRAGIFDRPFGYEISYSSSRRESPERSTVFQTLFPDERDLGGMLVLQAPETSPWSILRLEGGWFAGNGIRQESDNRRDFIGRLSVFKNWNRVSLGGGASYYNGSVFQGSAQVFTMDGAAFVLSDSPANAGKYAKREYVGFDVEFAANSKAGTTKLTAEYLFGTQPGNALSNRSPNSGIRPPADVPTYIRPFNGGYVMLVQSVGKWPVSVVAKYDWYDPNTKTSGDNIGAADSHTTLADIAVSTVGFGALWDIIDCLRLAAYYELNYNETTANLPGFTADREDNLFTLRLQYRF